MSNFVFGNADTYKSSAKPRLKGGEIHKVIFRGVKYEEIESKNDRTRGQKFNVMQITFDNEHGQFVHTEFDPGDSGNERGAIDWNGTKIIQPSKVEVIQLLIGQIMSVLNPDGLMKLANRPILGFEKLVNAISKLLKDNEGEEVELKLLINKDGSARLPMFASINRSGELYTSSNFISNKPGTLYFTDKEKSTITRFSNATPTDVEVVKKVINNDDLDLDLD
jgi:hypothetical protein